MHDDNARVLIVDDEAIARSAFARAARGQFEVDEADGATAAIDLTTRNEYDVIATDLLMPDVGGLSLIQHLLDAKIQSSFVLVTGVHPLDLPANEPAVRQISGIVKKPWQQDELCQVLTRAAARSRARRLGSRESDANALRVLILEDNELDAALLRRRLERAGNFALTRCERLSEALSCLAELPIDLVITDLSLPDACGLDAVTTLKRAFPGIAIVVMTCMEDQALARQVVQAGAQNYLVKQSVSSRTLAYTLTCAVETHRRELELTTKALCDPLTGLANREGLQTAYRRIHARAQRSETFLACLMLDLDLFKNINDSLGHAAGDAVLKCVAQRVQQQVRDADVVARLGGDEFCVVAEVEHAAQALLIRDRLRVALSQPVECNGNRLLATASVGVSVLSPDTGNLQQLLRAADRDMYAAKEERHSLRPPV